MLYYIATNNTAEIIKKVCKDESIMILYEQNEVVNINEYLKETKANFNLIKYFIIEVGALKNTKEEIIENINSFIKIHREIRIIILAQGLDSQDELLTQLYNIGIYNIINSSSESDIIQELKKAFSEKGIQKSEARRFEKIEETKDKVDYKNNIKKLVLYKKKQMKKRKIDLKNNKENIHQFGGVYFFALILETLSRLSICAFNCIKIVLILFGIIALFNSQTRHILFQILGLR